MYVCSKAGLNSGSPGTCAAGKHRRKKAWIHYARTLPGTLTMAVSITRRSSKPPICAACQYDEGLNVTARVSCLCPQRRFPHGVLQLGTRRQDGRSLHAHNPFPSLSTLVRVALHPSISIELCQVDLCAPSSVATLPSRNVMDVPAPAQLRRCAGRLWTSSPCPLPSVPAETRPGKCDRMSAGHDRVHTLGYAPSSTN